MNERTHIMRQLVSAEHPAEAATALSTIAAFLGEVLCTGTEDGMLSLSVEATTGLFWLLKLMEVGNCEIADQL
jgi:hypothetical protein